MFTLMTARESGVPPYSMSVSSASLVKSGNFGFRSRGNLFRAPLPHSRFRGVEQGPVELCVVAKPRPRIHVAVAFDDRSTFRMPFSAFSRVPGSATTLPPAIGSMSGAIFHAKMSPAAIARSAETPRRHRRWCGRRRSNRGRSDPCPPPTVIRSVNVFVGMMAGFEATRALAAIDFLVFSCVIFSTDAGK